MATGSYWGAWCGTDRPCRRWSVPHIYSFDNLDEGPQRDTDESYPVMIQGFEGSRFRELHEYVVKVVGLAWREPETPAADPPPQLDKVVTSPQDPHNLHFDSDLASTKIFFSPLALVVKAPLVCKSLRDLLRSRVFLETRAGTYSVEPNSLAPLLFYEQDGKLHMMGYDSSDTNTWIRTPPLPCCLFSSNRKSVAGHSGLLCVFVKGSNGAGMHFAYNPLMQNQRELLPMRFPRPPCVTNLHVTVAEKRYQVIAIGSQASGTHPRKTEIYDSKSNQWTDAPELPEGYLIDIQTGVYLEGYWYGTASRSLDGPKDVLVLDLENLKWLDSIVLPVRMAFPTTVQLLQSDGEIYLFSQDVFSYGLEVTHCIYRLNRRSEGGYGWTKKVNHKFVKKKPFYRAEYTCVPLKGKQGTKLGIFKNSCSVNAVTESVCRVYDITEDEDEITAASQFLPCPRFASEAAVLFHPENPVGYSFEPSFFVDA